MDQPLSRCSHIGVGIVPVDPEGGKIVRAASVSPLIKAGNVFLPHPQIVPG